MISNQYKIYQARSTHIPRGRVGLSWQISWHTLPHVITNISMILIGLSYNGSGRHCFSHQVYLVDMLMHWELPCGHAIYLKYWKNMFLKHFFCISNGDFLKLIFLKCNVFLLLFHRNTLINYISEFQKVHIWNAKEMFKKILLSIFWNDSIPIGF